MTRSSLEELLALYADLERSIRKLSRSADQWVKDSGRVAAIDVKRLLGDLRAAKEQVELRIQNKFLLEKGKITQQLRGDAKKLVGTLRALAPRQEDGEDHGTS